MSLIGGDQRENYLFSYSQAIQLQMKCVVLCEKVFGRIHPTTAQAYLNLHKFNSKLGNYEKAFRYLHRALYILEIVCGDNHPEISSIYLTFGFMYLEVKLLLIF